MNFQFRTRKSSADGQISKGLLASAIVLATILLAPARGSAFEVYMHYYMTDGVLQDQGVGGPVKQIVDFGSTWSDVKGCTPGGCYCFDLVNQALLCSPADLAAAADAQGPYHFDNDEIDRGIALVNTYCSEFSGFLGSFNPTLLTLPQAYHDIYVRCLHVGQALHAVQDFYSHTDYIELQVPLIKLLSSATPLYDGAPDLVGTWHMANGVTLNHLASGGFNKSTPEGVTHEQLNKDTNNSPEGQLTVYSPRFGQILGTLHQIAAGGDDFSFSFTGFAPRHTLLAWQSAIGGGTPFPYSPPEAPSRAPRPSASEQARLQKNLADFMTWAASDSMMQVLGNYMTHELHPYLSRTDSGWVKKFSFDLFDADGYPFLSTPVSRIDLEATPTMDGIRLSWPMSQLQGFDQLSVEKSQYSDGPWNRLTTITLTPSSDSFEDRSVDAGVWYYRLVGYGARGVVMLGSARVEIKGVGATAVKLFNVAPNPAQGPVSIRYELGSLAGRSVSLSVMDISGRRIRSLLHGAGSAGVGTIEWDGLDNSGRAAPSGMYLVHLSTPFGSRTQRVCLAR